MEQREKDGVVNSETYRPCLQRKDGLSGGLDESAPGFELMSDNQCGNTREMEDSQLVGDPVTIAGDAAVSARREVPVQMVAGLEGVRSAAAMNSQESRRKPRRGRPPRSQGRSTLAQPSPRRRRDEEDVCFICFDGGSLVLCDRRGCPKAYHPACIKRDESFFRSKAKWNCGWHICSSCQKASHYMCYTCTFSLCKECTKDAGFLCVRGNKGFCGICMRTVMLIENIPMENKEAVQVDFDDKSSWEYLFKVYWIYLKQKLSLTLEELIKAKNPWKAVVSWPPKVESPSGFCNNNEEKVCSLDNSCSNLEAKNSKRRKTGNQPCLLNQDFGGLGKSGGDERKSLPESMPRTTEELLESRDLSKDIESRTDQPQSSSLKVREGCEDEKWNVSQSIITVNPPKTSGSQSSITDANWKQLDGESYLGHASSGQSLGPAPINSNGWVSGSGIFSLTMSLETSQQKQEIHFPDLLSPTTKHSQGGLEGQATENKHSMSLSVLVLNSGPSWRATSSLLGGELQLPLIPCDGFGGSPTQTKDSVRESGSNLVSLSSLRPVEATSDYAAAPTSGSSQPTQYSAVHLANASSWQVFVPEPTEFYSLPDESVSDLLAEVEAMEALGRLGSPTSSISYGGEFTRGTQNDYSSPVDGFSPIPESGKSDALSSTGDLQNTSHGVVADESHGLAENFTLAVEPSQSSVTIESLGFSQIVTLDRQKRYYGHPSPSAEVLGDLKASAASVNLWEAGADVNHHPAPSTSEVSMGTVLGSSSSSASWGGQAQGNADIGLGISEGTR